MLELPLRLPGRSWNRGWFCWCGNEPLSLCQDMPGPTCQLTRDELEVTNSRKSMSSTVLGNVSSPVGQMENKATKISAPKDQGHHGAFFLLPMCSIYRAGPCAISSCTQLLSCASPRGSVPGHAVSHCHSSAFVVPLSSPDLRLSSSIASYMIPLSWKKQQKEVFFSSQEVGIFLATTKKVAIACFVQMTSFS